MIPAGPAIRREGVTARFSLNRKTVALYLPLLVIVCGWLLSLLTLSRMKLAESRDITERKEAEQKLRESEELFRVMFMESSVGKAQADPKTGRFLRVNAALCRITGYSEGSCCG